MVVMGNMELRQEVEVFLFEEASLLDKWQLNEWLDLFTEDTRYWMPMRETLPASEKPPEPGDLAYVLLDEDKGSLIARVTRLNTGRAHVEEPRSFTRHMVSNVLVQGTDKPDAVIAYSNIMAFHAHPRAAQHP